MTMKRMHYAALAAALTATVAVQAAVVDGVNYADSVEAYSSNIQNYGGTFLSSGSESWLTGAPDADVDGNGYGWDAGDLDIVAGWRSNAPSENIVMKWDLAIPDVAGDDLSITLYRGPNASANVLASVDGTSFTQIGSIDGGTPGYFAELTFDFDGLFADDVQYVKVERVANGPQTGMFFDAFGGAVAPEPTSLTLLAIGVAGLLRRRTHN